MSVLHITPRICRLHLMRLYLITKAEIDPCFVYLNNTATRSIVRIVTSRCVCGPLLVCDILGGDNHREPDYKGQLYSLNLPSFLDHHQTRQIYRRLSQFGQISQIRFIFFIYRYFFRLLR